MHIVIALDDCIRNVSSIRLELPNLTEQEWLDHKSLIAPHLRAEDKINRWYDEGHDIHIIAKKDQYDKQWLKDHYIPYNSIIKSIINIALPDYWIDSSLYRCFNVCPDISRIALINENIQEQDIKNQCKNLRLPYPLPSKINFTTWKKVTLV